jgi:hypothetical protein
MASRILSQNIHGLNDGKKEELVDFICTNNIFAFVIDETRRLRKVISPRTMASTWCSIAANRNVK